MEYKDFLTEVKDLNDKGEGILRFIRFHQEDKDADITLPGFIQQQPAVLIASHNWKSDEPPLGKGESFEADGATHFRFKLNLHDPRAQRWYSWLKMDRASGPPLQQISYGFSPHPDAQERKQQGGRQIRYLKPLKDGSPGAKLHEISFVTVGSGNDQGVLAIKSANDWLTEEEKQSFVAQSVLFPKSMWDSAEACRTWLRSHDYSAGTVDSSGEHYRFRQQDPGNFSNLATICITPSRDTPMERCRVKLVGGPLKSEARSMSEAREVSAAEPSEAVPATPPDPTQRHAPLPEISNTNPEDWQAYPEDRRPPLTALIKWLRLYRYHLPFLRDIRKRDGKEIAAETIAEFKALVEELLEVTQQFNIKLRTAALLPSVEEELAQQEHYKARHQELSAGVNAQMEAAFQALQAQGQLLEQRSKQRAALMRHWQDPAARAG